MKELPELKCVKEVSTAGTMMHFHQCLNKVKVVRNCESYCAIHDPERVAKVRKQRESKWAAEWKVKEAAWARDKQRVRLFSKMLQLLAKGMVVFREYQWAREAERLVAKAEKVDYRKESKRGKSNVGE
jgi:hypothetical protein